MKKVEDLCIISDARIITGLLYSIKKVYQPKICIYLNPYEVRFMVFNSINPYVEYGITINDIDRRDIIIKTSEEFVFQVDYNRINVNKKSMTNIENNIFKIIRSERNEYMGEFIKSNIGNNSAIVFKLLIMNSLDVDKSIKALLGYDKGIMDLLRNEPQFFSICQGIPFENLSSPNNTRINFKLGGLLADAELWFYRDDNSFITSSLSCDKEIMINNFTNPVLELSGVFPYGLNIQQAIKNNINNKYYAAIVSANMQSYLIIIVVNNLTPIPDLKSKLVMYDLVRCSSNHMLIIYKCDLHIDLH